MFGTDRATKESITLFTSFSLECTNYFQNRFQERRSAQKNLRRLFMKAVILVVHEKHAHQLWQK